MKTQRLSLYCYLAKSFCMSIAASARDLVATCTACEGYGIFPKRNNCRGRCNEKQFRTYPVMNRFIRIKQETYGLWNLSFVCTNQKWNGTIKLAATKGININGIMRMLNTRKTCQKYRLVSQPPKRFENRAVTLNSQVITSGSFAIQVTTGSFGKHTYPSEKLILLMRGFAFSSVLSA